MGAMQTAPLGAVGPGAIVATFYGFHPDFVARAIPDVWSIVSPEDAVEAREHGAGRALTRLFDVQDAAIARALYAADVDPCEALVLRLAVSGVDRESIAPYRGWDDDDWSAAADRLAERGWLDDRAITPAGIDAHAAVEADTDRMAQGPTRALGEDGLVELLGIMRPLAAALASSGTIPFPNPIGVPPASTG
jgi:hypothetical protein